MYCAIVDANRPGAKQCLKQCKHCMLEELAATIKTYPERGSEQMTVDELIEKLKTYKGSAPVVICNSPTGEAYNEIELDIDENTVMLRFDPEDE